MLRRARLAALGTLVIAASLAIAALQVVAIASTLPGRALLRVLASLDRRLS